MTYYARVTSHFGVFLVGDRCQGSVNLEVANLEVAP